MNVKNIEKKYKILILVGLFAILGFLGFLLLSNREEEVKNPTISIAKTKVDLSMYDNRQNKDAYMVDVAPATPEPDSLPHIVFERKRTLPRQPQARKPHATTELPKQHVGEEDELEKFLSGTTSNRTTSGARRETPTAAETNKAISAVIYGDQKIRSGERVRLRTTTSGMVGNLHIPSNCIIYGVGNLNGNRMMVRISKVVINGTEETRGFGNSTAIYDATDGELGIYVQGIDVGETVKGGARDIASGVLTQGGVAGRMANSIITKTTSGETEILLLNNTKLIIQ